MFMINETKLCELYPSMCTVQQQTIADGVFHLQFDPVMRHKVALDPKDIFRCTMKSTVPVCSSFNCLDVTRRSYFRPPSSMCYTMDANHWAGESHRFKKCNMPWTWDLTIRADWRPDKVMQLQNSEKLPLVVHRSETCPPDRLSSIAIKPGLSYTVSVAQQTVRRLPPPYASKCTDYKSMGIKEEFTGYLTQDLCVQECLIHVEKQTCGCIRSTHEFAANFPVPTCNHQAHVVCDKQVTNATLQKCLKKCGPPCEETSYDVRLTSLGEERKHKDRIAFGVSVKFSSDSQKIFEYQPKLTVIEAFGYMGGYIGMWLGLSLYSLITDGEKWMRNFFLRRAAKAKEGKKMAVKESLMKTVFPSRIIPVTSVDKRTTGASEPAAVHRRF
ncbi:amiloride-sensitive sodium channel subunit alpha-like [Ornithodoros turicata]|uniref:amiloride-sensitive sodium channel subunit alpha-like n=1 Tax=Ornithodoros turicata TaxID=34597 RepID=UPI003139BD8C